MTGIFSFNNFFFPLSFEALLRYWVLVCVICLLLLSTVCSVSGRPHASMAQLVTIARCAARYKAMGMMLTDFADVGHLHPLVASTVPLVASAAVSWRCSTTVVSFLSVVFLSFFFPTGYCLSIMCISSACAFFFFVFFLFLSL